jgi:creatinine amidohydrolase
VRKRGRALQTPTQRALLESQRRRTVNVNYAEMTWVDTKREIEEDAIAVLPTGCIEQHGPHLPLDCDAVSPAPAVARACREHGLRALVLPVLPFGPAAEHMSFPGTISLSQQTHMGVVREIVESLLHHGFRRIVIMRGCGGHLGLEAAVYALWAQERRKGRDVVIEVAPLFAAEPLVQDVVENHFPGCTDVHAGEFETSICLASRPHLVARDRIPETTSAAPAHGSWWALAEEISDHGAAGEPRRATAEAGRELADALERSIGAWLAEFDARTGRQSRRGT